MFWTKLSLWLLLVLAVYLGQVWMGCALGLALYLARPSIIKILRSTS